MRFRTFLVCILGVLMLGNAALFGQTSGQDSWTYSGKRLATPDTTTPRKCITVGKDGIYVGKMNAGATAGIGVEQYTLAGQFVQAWAQTFTDLSGLASDSDGNVYAFDRGAAKVFIFDSAGTVIRSWGSAGSGDGQFSTAAAFMCHAIAVDDQKNVYVADWKNYRVQKFDYNGNFLLKFGTQGNLPGQFQDGPGGVVVTALGKLVAYDAPNDWNHLVLFDLNGYYGSRSSANSIGWHESSNTGYSGAVFAKGGERLLCSQVDGGLIVGAEMVSNFSAVAGTSRVFSPYTLTTTSSFTFPTAATTRGGASTPRGDVYVVRDKVVELMERRMRFDTHVPTKAVPQPMVFHVSQAAGTQVVDIDFRVTDTDSPLVETALVGFVDGTRAWNKLVLPKTFTNPVAGVLGVDVATGAMKRASWNAGADLPGQSFASLSFEVLAKDDRPEMGVHLVTLPSDAQNPSALKLSNKPIDEESLTDLWLWLLAKGDPRVEVIGNTVALTAQGQTFLAGAPTPLTGTAPASSTAAGTMAITVGSSNVVVASTALFKPGMRVTGTGIPANTTVVSITNPTTFVMSANATSTSTTATLTIAWDAVHNGTVTTTAGRAFAYKLMNWRPVTAAEKTRAAAGKFNLSSVTDNSVVSLQP
jgi:hypothetical protein